MRTLLERAAQDFVKRSGQLLDLADEVRRDRERLLWMLGRPEASRDDGPTRHPEDGEAAR